MSVVFFSIIILLSVYSPFSDRVGLPLHNIPSLFLPVMNVFSVVVVVCPLPPSSSANPGCTGPESSGGPDLPFFLGMRTRWMAGAAAHKSG